VGWYQYNKNTKDPIVTDIGPATTDTPTPPPPPIPAPVEAEKKDVDPAVNIPDNTVTPQTPNNGVIKLSVKGNTLEELREKLKAKSNTIMKNKEYTAEDVKFDPQRHYFSCNLVPATSTFTKLSLAYGPISSGGCESCDNVILRNPGSEVLVNVSDANYIYNIILIAE
jgi:hypothetical protein